MADLLIKQDPDTKGASPSALSEDDIYEDAGDLEFNANPDYEKMYLVKIPTYLWEAWSKLDQDAEIPIGQIRQKNTVQPNGAVKQELSMLLHRHIPEHQTIPKEYDLKMTEVQKNGQSEFVKNTFAFSERDLPGFKSNRPKKFDPASANMPARLTRPKNDRLPLKEPYDSNKRASPYVRQGIPKRTRIEGRVRHEANCVAVDTPEASFLLAQRTLEAMRPKVFTKFIDDDVSTSGKGFIQPGTIGAQNAFRSFIKTKNPTQGHRPQMQKTARMPQNELMDKIFACFRRYNYWSMRSFRNELQQPEAYLRETLEPIAVLAKSGKFATHWSLKPEFRKEHYEDLGDAIAPVEEGGAEDSDMADEEDEDDEDVKFEDVA